MPPQLHVPIIFAVAMMLCPGNLSATNTEDAQVKAIALRYNQFEGQLHRAVHYVTKENAAGDETKTDQAWIHETGDVLKVARESIGSAGRRLTEFFFNEDKMLMFVLTRRETPLADGGTKVEEERLYFGGGDQGPIRDLVKTASFKRGEPLDTVGVRNVTRDVSKRPKNPEEGSYDYYSRVAGEILETLKANPPARDPRKDAGGDSARCRLIQESASPDGRYALAIGLGRKEINWEEFAEDVDGVDVYTVEPRDAPDLQNYLVDLDTHLILGETGCQYFGTRTSYNHNSCSVVWSPDSATFVQLTAEKWNYIECRAGRIAAGPKLAGTVDIGKAAEKASSAHKRAKNRDEGSIAIDLGEVSNNGVIQLQLSSQSPTGPNKGDIYFAVTERLRLRSTPAGLHLDTLDVRDAPLE